MKQVIVTPHRIRPLEGEDDVQRCAEIMVISEPWVTLGRTREAALKLLSDPSREISVAADPESGELFGFVIVLMQGAFVGYIQTVAVAAQCRGRGIGSLLIAHAESRIFRESPNVFLCVSSFNHSARALYERLGYAEVAELHDYVVRGYSEFLMRKTRGALNEFRASGHTPSPSST